MSDGPLRRLSPAALVLLVTLIFAGLARTVIVLPPDAAGLSDEVNAGLARSGALNPVSATLLDFRSYDTLLEIAVLLLAVVAVRAIRRGGLPTIRAGDEILVFLSRALVPVMILIAGYLVMAGLDASGGAFQAGAILGAVGVLLILAGSGLPLRDEALPIRFGLAVGLCVFIAVGIAGMLVANAFLDYPQRGAGDIMLLVEVGVTVSVALALVDLFGGVLRRGECESTKRATDRR